jgi:hypothetical protein
MNAEDLWEATRGRQGTCILCEAQLRPDEDFAVCDKCWPDEEGTE